MKKREFIKLSAGASLGAAALFTIPSGATRLTETHTKVDPTTRRRNLIPNVLLLTHEGKKVHFYEDLIKDKIVLINFMYVRCGDICPGMTANLRRVQDEFGDRMGKDVFMYSISLEQDTPEMLKGYAELFAVKPGWTFLTGKKEDINLLRTKLGFKSSDKKVDEDKTQHTGMIRVGVERLERWGMAGALAKPKFIADTVRFLEPSSRESILSLVSPLGLDA